jgi:hypothetical protein
MHTRADIINGIFHLGVAGSRSCVLQRVDLRVSPKALRVRSSESPQPHRAGLLRLASVPQVREGRPRAGRDSDRGGAEAGRCPASLVDGEGGDSKTGSGFDLTKCK